MFNNFELDVIAIKMDIAKTDLEKNLYSYKKDIGNNNYNNIYILFKEIIKVLIDLKN